MKLLPCVYVPSGMPSALSFNTVQMQHVVTISYSNFYYIFHYILKKMLLDWKYQCLRINPHIPNFYWKKKIKSKKKTPESILN